MMRSSPATKDSAKVASHPLNTTSFGTQPEYSSHWADASLQARTTEGEGVGTTGAAGEVPVTIQSPSWSSTVARCASAGRGCSHRVALASYRRERIALLRGRCRIQMCPWRWSSPQDGECSQCQRSRSSNQAPKEDRSFRFPVPRRRVDVKTSRHVCQW